MTLFDEEVAIGFAQNLIEDYLEVGGMRIEVFEQIIVEVTGLLRRGKSWFGWKFLVSITK